MCGEGGGGYLLSVCETTRDLLVSDERVRGDEKHAKAAADSRCHLSSQSVGLRLCVGSPQAEGGGDIFWLIRGVSQFCVIPNAMLQGERLT